MDFVSELRGVNGTWKHLETTEIICVCVGEVEKCLCEVPTTIFYLDHV